MLEQNLIIQSKEIGLRLLHEKDRERFFFVEQDLEINRFIKIPKPNNEIEEAFLRFKKLWTQENSSWHVLAIVDVETDEFLGFASYRYRDKSSLIVEIGWKLHPIAQRRGIATAAAKLLVKYLIENHSVHKLVAHCDADHLASERIMQKIGMQKEGLLKSNFKIGDTWRDELVYGLVVDND